MRRANNCPMCRPPTVVVAPAPAACAAQFDDATAATDEKAAKEAGFLREARWPVCVVVCACYCVLSWRGVSHLRRIRADGGADLDALFRDFAALLALYAAETAGAAACGVTTMYHWVRRNFYEHHLPLVVVGGLTLACCRGGDLRPLGQHQEWCSLILLISLNEATAALLILWPDPTLQAARIGPNFCIQSSLLATELYSYARAARRRRETRADPAMAVPFLLTQFLLVAAAVHVDYIRQIVRSCRKRPRAELHLAAAGGAATVALALTFLSAPPKS